MISNKSCIELLFQFMMYLNCKHILVLHRLSSDIIFLKFVFN